MTTCAPCELKSRTVASPIPLAPPVITATLPSSRPMVIVLLVGETISHALQAHQHGRRRSFFGRSATLLRVTAIARRPRPQSHSSEIKTLHSAFRWHRSCCARPHVEARPPSGHHPYSGVECAVVPPSRCLAPPGRDRPALRLDPR